MVSNSSIHNCKQLIELPLIIFQRGDRIRLQYHLSPFQGFASTIHYRKCFAALHLFLYFVSLSDWQYTRLHQRHLHIIQSIPRLQQLSPLRRNPPRAEATLVSHAPSPKDPQQEHRQRHQDMRHYFIL